MSRATHSIHRRANQIELAAAIGLPILMGLLALLSHMHLDVVTDGRGTRDVPHCGVNRV